MAFCCSLCDYQTNDQSNYKKHLKTQKHQKNEEKNTKQEENSTKKEEKTTIQLEDKTKTHPEYICEWCKRLFKRSDNLQRHIQLCKSKFALNCSSLLPNLKVNNTIPQSRFSCQGCQITFSKKFNLERHLKKCQKIENTQLMVYKNRSKNMRKNIENIENNSKTLKVPKSNNYLKCNYCQNNYLSTRSLNRHLKSCFIKQTEIQQLHHNQHLEIERLKSQQQLEIEKLKREKEQAINLEKDKQLADKQQAIDIAKNSQHITINHNKTINFLNNNYGEMIAMETFLKSLENTHQLTLQERKDLLNAYNECGIDVFARNFSYIMKQNCKRQLESQGIEDMKLLPLFCSDGNLRSHKEKQLDGWKTLYDNQSINQMLNISNQQIHDSYQQIVPISGRERTKIYKEVKRDNHQNKLIKDI